MAEVPREADRRLFHVNSYAQGDGDCIQPGYYGAGSREPSAKNPAFKPERLGALLWEATLETARLAVAPSAPTRLRCVFAAETLDMARSFRDRFRLGAGIYAVEPWQDAVLFRGDFGIVTDIDPAAPFLDYMPKEAIRYWTEPPGNQVEVLVGGPVTVIERVE